MAYEGQGMKSFVLSLLALVSAAPAANLESLATQLNHLCTGAEESHVDYIVVNFKEVEANKFDDYCKKGYFLPDSFKQSECKDINVLVNYGAETAPDKLNTCFRTNPQGSKQGVFDGFSFDVTSDTIASKLPQGDTIDGPTVVLNIDSAQWSKVHNQAEILKNSHLRHIVINLAAGANFELPSSTSENKAKVYFTSTELPSEAYEKVKPFTLLERKEHNEKLESYSKNVKICTTPNPQ